MFNLALKNDNVAQLDETRLKLLGQRENVLSDRYKLVTTQDVLQDFLSQGFTISKMSYSTRRGKKELGLVENTHGAHIVRLRNEALKIGNDYIEVVVSNSYNGTIPFNVSLGIFRLVCSNGLMVGNSIFKESIKHVGDDFYDRVNVALNESLKHVNHLKGAVESMRSRILSQDEILEFSNNVLSYRLKDVNGLIGIDFNRTLRPNRVEDEGRDLFTVLNVLQEKSLRGGVHYTTETVKENENGTTTVKRSQCTTREVYSPKKTIDVNEYIFNEGLKLVA